MIACHNFSIIDHSILFLFLSNLYSSNVFLLENLDKIKSLQLKDFTSILKTELPRFNHIKIGDCTPYNLATRVRENII